jgi:hypothetical protein
MDPESYSYQEAIEKGATAAAAGAGENAVRKESSRDEQKCRHTPKVEKKRGVEKKHKKG